MIQIQEDIVGMLRNAFEQFSDQHAYTCMGQTLSYKELDELSDNFSVWLKNDPELQAGDRVAIQLPNLLQYPVAAIGILKAGLVIVNINPLYSADEVQHQLNDSGAKALVVLANMASKALKVIEHTSLKSVIVTELADLHSPFKRLLLNAYARYVKNGRLKEKFPIQFSFREVLAAGRNDKTKNVYVTNEDANLDDKLKQLAVLQYTGGTTGISKGAMLSHGNLLSSMVQLEERLAEECPVPGSVMVGPLPLYHIYAFAMNILYALHRGQHSILIPDPRNVPRFVKSIKGHKISGFVGINTLYDSLCANAEFCTLDFSSLIICSSAGMALSTRTAKRWHEVTGCRILEGYGLTESAPMVSCVTYSDYLLGSVGKACIDTQIKIVGSEGQELGAKEEGEIVIKGPQIMSGYWQQKEETDAVLDEDGWLRTGDIGVLDDEGRLRIVDRIKDLIIISGFNVYPNEIEDCISKHPDILEAAAVGVKVGEVEENVKLFVVTSNPELSRVEIIDYCRQGLAAYKVPKLIEFRDSLPKSNVGKVLRRELKNG